MAEAGSSTNETRRRCVLVVEPDLYVRDFIASALQDVGLQVLAAGNATEARHALRGAHVDLALIAVMLARVGGEKLALEIEQRGIPVVLMTGHEERLRRAHASGFPVLAKPFGVKGLLRALALNIRSWTAPEP